MIKNFTTTCFLIAALFSCHLVYSQCNGSQYLCSKPYNEVAYLTTHNAFNAQDQGFFLPNQNVGITQQLNDGVRGLMLDVYNNAGTAVVYHGSSLLGSESFQNILLEIKTFLDNNPNEVVTIILESYVTSSVIETEMINAGVFNYLYSLPISGQWDTLQDMINTNKRLVIFSDVDDALVGQDWYHYAWDHCVETHYSVNTINDFNNAYNRGVASNALFIFNHFVTNSVTGTGLPAEAPAVNDYTFLTNRIQQHFAEYSKFPNFITLDFYDLGNGMQVVDSLNSPTVTLSLNDNVEGFEISIYPNPATSIINLKCSDEFLGKKAEVVDMQGNVVLVESLITNYTSIELENLCPGFYMVKIDQIVVEKFVLD